MKGILVVIFLILPFASKYALGEEGAETCVYLDQRMGHKYRPNCRGVAHHPGQKKFSTFFTNNVGIRDQNYSEYPDSDTYRILYIGASNSVSFNFSDGLVPQIRQAVNSQYFSEKKFTKRFKKIEVIAAAEEGYAITQTFMRIDELLAAYNPHLVLLDDTFEFMLPKAIFEHTFARSRENNLVADIGINDPVTTWSHSKILGWFGLKNLFYVSSIYMGLKISLIKSVYFLYPSLICGRDHHKGCIVDIYFSYINGIREKAKARSADLLVLYYTSNFFETYRSNLRVWYDMNWIQDKIIPKHFIGETERFRFRELLKNSGVKNLDLSDDYTWAYDQQRSVNRYDHHLSLDISNKLGTMIGAKLGLYFQSQGLPIIKPQIVK